MYIYLDEMGVLVTYESFINTSCTRAGCFGPVLEYDLFKVAQQDNGDLSITWGLLNGVSGELRALSNEVYGTEAENGLMALASSGLYLTSLPLAAINGEMVLSQVDSKYQVASINRDPFPSLEAYSYQDGQYNYTLALLVENGLGPFWGLNPIARNERYNSPVWHNSNSTLLLNGSFIPD